MRLLFVCAAAMSLCAVTASSGQPPRQEQIGETTDCPLQVQIAPVDGKAFPFGQFCKTAFTLTNVSGYAVVALGIQPLPRRHERAILLTSEVGGFEKLDGRDAYRVRSRGQEPARSRLHHGLLLPGEQVTVHGNFRAVAREERFQINCDIADGRPYDGTVGSLAPFVVYIRDDADGKENQPPLYVPFEESKWKASYRQGMAILTAEDYRYRSAVVIDPQAVEALRKSRPGERIAPPSTRRSWAASVHLDYEGTPFVLEDARKAIARIRGNEQECLAVYCLALGGYVVFEKGREWILRSPDQSDRGPLLPMMSNSLIGNLDLHGKIEVRVGEKPQASALDGKPAGWTFWGRYPVHYGDDWKYQPGEFITITGESLLAFLQTVGEQGYYVQAVQSLSREWYVLQKPPQVP